MRLAVTTHLTGLRGSATALVVLSSRVMRASRAVGAVGVLAPSRLERQDSAALFALLGARDKAVAQLREHHF